MQSTGEFELGILTQEAAQAARPANPALTSDSALTVGLEPCGLVAVRSLEDMQAAINRVAASAQRLMSIYTPDMEPDLYDQSPFLDIAKRFVLARNFAKIRVLISVSKRLPRDDNRFVAMGRRLGSYIEMRFTAHPIAQRATSYLIADDRALVLRCGSGVAEANAWNGVVDFASTANARCVLNEFDVVWQANIPDDQAQTAAM